MSTALLLLGPFALGRYRVRAAASATVACVKDEAVPLPGDSQGRSALLASSTIRLRHRINVAAPGDGRQPKRIVLPAESESELDAQRAEDSWKNYVSRSGSSWQNTMPAPSRFLRASPR